MKIQSPPPCPEEIRNLCIHAANRNLTMSEAEEILRLAMWDMSFDIYSDNDAQEYLQKKQKKIDRLYELLEKLSSPAQEDENMDKIEEIKNEILNIEEEMIDFEENYAQNCAEELFEAYINEIRKYTLDKNILMVML